MFGDTAPSEQGTILNISMTGCALTAEHIPELHSHTSIHIYLPDSTEPVDIESAGVLWVSDYRCGLEFIRVSDVSLARLRVFVSLLENTP
ncbi:MAG: PilZ domain-containing protein [Nitrospira sp.]|nr:PilZ domain-containing protein [Nitrospira sp.]